MSINKLHTITTICTHFFLPIISPQKTGNRGAFSILSSDWGVIWRAGRISKRVIKESRGILIPHTFIDSNFRHLFTRTWSPFSVTWRHPHNTTLCNYVKYNQYHFIFFILLKIAKYFHLFYLYFKFGQLTFKFGQLVEIANKDSSVMKVPPMFRCCNELALEICTWSTRKGQLVCSQEAKSQKQSSNLRLWYWRLEVHYVKKMHDSWRFWMFLIKHIPVEQHLCLWSLSFPIVICR